MRKKLFESAKWKFNGPVKRNKSVTEVRTFNPLKGWGLEVIHRGKGIAVWLTSKDVERLYQYLLQKES